MKTPDEEVLKAIVNLEGNASWQVIKRWLRQSLTSAFDASSEMRTGMAWQLTDMLDEIDAARINLEKARKYKK